MGAAALVLRSKSFAGVVDRAVGAGSNSVTCLDGGALLGDRTATRSVVVVSLRSAVDSSAGFVAEGEGKASKRDGLDGVGSSEICVRRQVPDAPWPGIAAFATSACTRHAQIREPTEPLSADLPATASLPFATPPKPHQYIRGVNGVSLALRW